MATRPSSHSRGEWGSPQSQRPSLCCVASVFPPMRWGCDRSVPGGAHRALRLGEQTQGCAPAASRSGLSGAPRLRGRACGASGADSSLSFAPPGTPVPAVLAAGTVFIMIVSVPTSRVAHPPECSHWGPLKPANSRIVAAREPGRAWVSPSFQGGE